MSKIDKLISRFLMMPRDFTWKELEKLLAHFEFILDNKGKTSGSRVNFFRVGCQPIMLHKPHPGNILRAYQIKYIKERLEEENLL